MHDRVLLDYLPAPLRDIREFKAIFEAKQSDYEALWREIRHILKEKSLQTATENGISRWEGILKITPSVTDTLEDRRICVQTKVLGNSRMNLAILRRNLDVLCGEGTYEIDYRPDEYYIGVRVSLQSKHMDCKVLEMLDRDMPANFLVFVSLLYITYGRIAKLTYGEVADFTYQQLREDADLMRRLGD